MIQTSNHRLSKVSFTYRTWSAIYVFANVSAGSSWQHFWPHFGKCWGTYICIYCTYILQTYIRMYLYYFAYDLWGRDGSVLRSKRRDFRVEEQWQVLRSFPHIFDSKKYISHRRRWHIDSEPMLICPYQWHVNYSSSRSRRAHLDFATNEYFDSFCAKATL